MPAPAGMDMTMDARMPGDEDLSSPPADVGPDAATCEATPSATLCREASLECGTHTLLDPVCGTNLEVRCGVCAGTCVQGACMRSGIEVPEGFAGEFGHSISARDGVLVIGAPGVEPRGAAVVYTRDGDAWVMQRTLVPDDEFTARFGAAVHASSRGLFVGAPQSFLSGNIMQSTGVAYFYDMNQGAPPTRFYPDRYAQFTSSPAEFGSCFVEHGDDLSVCAPGTTRITSTTTRPQAGLAFLFSVAQNEFSHVNMTRAPWGGANERRSTSATLVNGLLALGSPGLLTDDNYNRNSNIEIYERVMGGWNDVSRQLRIDDINDKQTEYLDETGLGFSITADGGWLVSGTPQLIPREGDRDMAFGGVAWATTTTVDGEWEIVQHHAPLDSPSDELGFSVVIQGDLTVAGAPAHEGNQGRLDLFRLTGTQWEFVSSITSPEPKPGSRFGASLAIDGDTLFVGAPGDENVPGEVFAFDLDDL